MKKAVSILLTIAAVLLCTSVLSAKDTGKEINNLCRKNLKTLNELTAKFVEKEGAHLPKWAKYSTLEKNFFPLDYLPKNLVKPTNDCEYCLVSNNDENFQWYCKLHGVLEGDTSIIFQYREHRIMAKTTKEFMNNENYKNDTVDLLRWTDYSPTVLERLKYQYNMNPMATVLAAVGFIFILYIVYRTI